MALLGVLVLVVAGPAVCTLFRPAPMGRTIMGVKQRLHRDLPNGTSADSAIAYLNHVGVRYVIVHKPTGILGWEDGVLPAPLGVDGNLKFEILFDEADHVRGDTVYEERIGL
jgi:hypothetical protein